MQRPNNTRFEIISDEQHFLRIFDGTRGWRIVGGTAGPRPYRSPPRKPTSLAASVIEGPLIDYEAKGVAVHAGGPQEIEGRKAYIPSVSALGGQSPRVD